MDKIEAIATQFADAVRSAFTEVYGEPRDPEYKQAVWPTWSDHGIDVGWHDPDPGVVLIFSEYMWILDPWTSSEDHKLWEKAMKILEDKGWNRTAFESINAGVHIVYWLPRREWQTILMKRVMDKRR